MELVLKKNRIVKGFLVACMMLSIVSCRVKLIDNFNAEIANQTENVSKEVNRLYLTMLDTENTAEARAYQVFAKQYIDIEVELNSIWKKNGMRPKNENSTKIAENTLILWKRYKERHKKENTISNFDINLNRKGMEAIFYPLKVAEDIKTKEENNN